MSAATSASTRELHDMLVKRLAAEGRIVQAGFQAFAFQLLPDATPEQIDAARTAYMAGAQHLYASIMGMLDPESEPTMADLHRMSQIDRELRMVTAELHLRATRAAGSGVPS